MKYSTRLLGMLCAVLALACIGMVQADTGKQYPDELKLQSPNGQFTISLVASDQGAFVLTKDNKTGAVSQMSCTRQDGSVVGVWANEPKGPYHAALSAPSGEGTIQLARDPKSVRLKYRIMGPDDFPERSKRREL